MIRCTCPCHRATHWCSAATFISSRRAALTPPSKTLSKFKVSKTLNEHWPYNLVEPGYLRTRPIPHSSSNSLRKSLLHTDPRLGCISLPTQQASELLRVASSFKRRRESRKLRSTVPSAAVLFVVFVGPSELGLCLTGALHYTPYMFAISKYCMYNNLMFCVWAP